jgi:hypothetical protein
LLGFPFYLNDEDVFFSEISVDFYRSTHCYISKDRTIQNGWLTVNW